MQLFSPHLFHWGYFTLERPPKSTKKLQNLSKFFIFSPGPRGDLRNWRFSADIAFVVCGARFFAEKQGFTGGCQLLCPRNGFLQPGFGLWRSSHGLYPYPLSRQKTGVSKVDSSPSVKAGGTEGTRRATGVPTATPYTSAGVR